MMTHRKYTYDGNRLPSVTEILNVVSKPYLIPWANRMGLNGINLDEKNAITTSIGTLVHHKIECYFRNRNPDQDDYSDEVRTKADEVFLKFLRWNSEHDIEPHYLELPMVSSEFGGTIDAVVNLNGVKTILDWKTSKDIYQEYFGQLSAYYYLLRKGKPMDTDDMDTVNEIRQFGEGIKQVGIVLIPKEDEEARIRIMDIKSNEFRKSWEYFSSCLRLWKAKENLQ